MKRLLALLLFIPGLVLATSYTCTNNASADASGWTSGLAAGGTFTVTGPTCNLTGGGTFFIGGSTTVIASGGVTVNGNGATHYQLQLNGNNVTVKFFIFNTLSIKDTFSNSSYFSTATRNNINISNNVFQNITNGDNGINGTDSFWFQWIIDSNSFINITTIPLGSMNSSLITDNGQFAGACAGVTNGCAGEGIVNEGNFSGAGNLTVTNNYFDTIEGNGIAVKFGGSIGCAVVTSGVCTTTAALTNSSSNNSYSYNEFVRVHRMANEDGGGSCAGSCNYGALVNLANWKLAGNYAHDFQAPYWNTYMFSFNGGTLTPQFINNTAELGNSPGGAGYGYELGNKNEIFQGNVCTYNSGAVDWGVCNESGYAGTGYTVLQQNNFVATNTSADFGFGDGQANYGGTWITRYNYVTTNCDTPTNCATSNLSTAFISAGGQTFPTGGNGTWTFYTTGQLSTKFVNFYIDSSTIPIVTQELGDVNTNFPTDRKWTYHATFNTSSLSAGSHTIKAIATDVSNATVTKTQTFTVGTGGGTPSATWTLSTLTFGVITVGSSSTPQANTLTNGGTASLTISGGITIGGANPSDFSKTTTCTATLTAGSSCTATITFTPTVTGPRTATVSITDNATGSPHTFSLIGGPAPCNNLFVLNCNFSTGSTNWIFNSAPYGTIVVDATGPTGGNAAHMTATSSVPPGQNIEALQAGISYPANGTIMRVQFDANTNAAQQINVVAVNSTTFLTYGLTCMPSISSGGWNTYFCGPFTIINSPAPGDGLLSFQADNATSGNQVYVTNVSLMTISSAPIASLSSNSVGFGSQVVGHTSTAAPITLSNTGTSNLVISGITMGGANPSDFGQTNTCSTIAPGSTCTITPSFTPTIPGLRGAAIMIADNDASSPQTISLSGTGGSHLSITGFDSLDHSVVRLIVNTDFVITGLAGSGCPGGCIGRTRSIQLPNSCLNNTNGLLQPQEIGATYSTQQAPGTTLWMNVTGLAPAAVGWDICPEISKDSGLTWLGGVDQQVITTALPAIHPAPPIAPKPVVNWLYPDTSNPSNWVAATLATDCSDLGSQYASAVARSLTQGTVMLEPIGSTCGAGGNLNFAIKPPDVVSFASSDVNFSANTITLHGTASSVVVGEGLRFGLDYKALQTWPHSTSCEFGQGLVTGQVFYVDSVVTPSTNTVKLLCGDKLTKMVFTDAGVDDSLPFLWVPEIRNLHKIILRSAAPDNQLPPPGVLITHDWDSKLANITSQLINLNNRGAGGTLMTFTNNDGNNEFMISDITIGPGIRINHVDSPESHQTSDPLPWWTFALIPPSSSNIGFDRDIWDMGGAPARVSTGVFWDGYNNWMVNNYFDNINWYHAEITGGAIAQTSSLTFSVASGIVNEGGGNITFPAYTVNLVGSSPTTHGVYVGLDMTNANVFTVWTPSGMTANCTPACANKTATGTWTATCDYNDAWQKNSNSNPTVGEIGCLDVNPTIIASRAALPYVSRYNPEGAAWFINGLGPGPWFFYGNYTRCAGLCYHQDDSGTIANMRANSTWLANYFVTPFEWMHYPANLALNPLSDGLSYYHRQDWEEKGGRNTLFKGNIMTGNFNDVEASAGFGLYTSVNGMGIRDVDIQSNTVMHGPGVFSLAFVTAGSNFAQTPPVLRYRAENNFAWDIGSASFHAGRQALPPPGWFGEGPNASQDVIIKHNTLVNTAGTNNSLMWNFDLKTEGVDVQDNILLIPTNTQGLGLDGTEPSWHPCNSLIGKPLADCIFPGYVWKNNLMIGLGQTPTAVASAWSGLTNYFQTGSGGLSAVGWQNFQLPPTLPTNELGSFDGCLAAKSAWVAGSASVNNHGGNVGVDCDKLKRDQQILTNVHVVDNLLHTTDATIAYTAPTLDSCYVDYATEPTVVVNPTRIKDPGGYVVRNVVVPSLITKTQYWYRVMCQGNIVAQQKGTFTTR